MKRVKGILLMGGEGKRFKDQLPKQFHPLKGKPVYLWAYETMVQSALFESIILVCPAQYRDQVAKQTQGHVVEGGATRQESSYKGLLACGPETDIVLIHDAVRPFVSEEILKANVTQAQIHGAVNTCIPSSDTIVYSKEGKTVTSIPNRSEYLRGQTPQTFSYPLILKAHKKTNRSCATDDCALVLDLGVTIFIVQGDERNMKITSPHDLIVAESLY